MAPWRCTALGEAPTAGPGFADVPMLCLYYLLLRLLPRSDGFLGPNIERRKLIFYSASLRPRNACQYGPTQAKHSPAYRFGRRLGLWRLWVIRSTMG
jgi:hypothetical protein